jgi:general secretion pathway protein A
MVLAASAGPATGNGLANLPGAVLVGSAADAVASAAASPTARPAASAAASAAPSAAAGASHPPGVLPAAAATDWPVLLPEPGLAALSADEARVWRELAPLWGWQAPATAADVCLAARLQQLRCYRTAAGTLAQLQQLDRPVMLLLHGGDGPPRHVRLAAFNARGAVLSVGAQRYQLPLDELARLWRGEFATFWRAPEGYSRMLEAGARGPAVDALAQGLARLRQEPAPPAGQALTGPLAGRLAGFQLAQGLKPDGIAGPTTFMQLNRAQGVAEPRLGTDLPER